jgi:phage gp29-like protein
MEPKNDNNLTDEILSSERIGSFMNLAYGLQGQGLPDNPSWVWEQLRWNPWLSMVVYEDLEEKDDQVAMCLDARKENVLAKSRRVLPAGDKRQDHKLAEFIEETLESYFDVQDGAHIGFENVLYEALDAIGKGVAIGETIYGEAADRIFIKDVRFKPQHLFSFGEGRMAAYSTSTYPYPQTGPLRLRPGIFGEGLSSETPLPEKKFFVHSFRPRHGNRWGSPLLRKVFWLSWFKRAQVKNWLRYGEKGAGSVIARYNDGAGEAEQALALDAARAIFEESAVALPKKFLVDNMEHVRQSMGSTYSEFVDDFCNNGIARVIRGQTLTSRGSEGGGSRSLGEVHERGEARKTEVDSKSLMMAVNTRLVWPLTLMNFGPVARPPVWGINYETGKDLTEISNWLQRLWQMHVPIKRDFVYNTFQLPEPGEDEEVLPPPASNQEDTSPSEATGGGGEFAEQQKKKPRPSSDRLKKPLDDVA